MNVNIETTSALRRKMTIELESGEINRELDRAYNELKRSVVMKGFRPGHAPRNLLERVEVLFPIKDAMLKQRIRGEILEAYLADNVQARILQPDGRYVYADALRSRSGSSKRGVYFNAQEFLIALSEGKVTLDSIPQLPAPRRRTVRRTVKAR